MSCEGLYLGVASHPSFKRYAHGTTFRSRFRAVHSEATMTILPGQPTASCNSVRAEEEGADMWREDGLPTPGKAGLESV